MKLLQKNKIKNNLNTELTEMGVFSAVAGNQLPNPLQKRVLPALLHLRCPSQSHQRSARGRTRLTTVTSISCRSFQRQLLYLIYLRCCDFKCYWYNIVTSYDDVISTVCTCNMQQVQEVRTTVYESIHQLYVEQQERTVRKAGCEVVPYLCSFW